MCMVYIARHIIINGKNKANAAESRICAVALSSLPKGAKPGEVSPYDDRYSMHV